MQIYIDLIIDHNIGNLRLDHVVDTLPLHVKHVIENFQINTHTLENIHPAHDIRTSLANVQNPARNFTC